MVPKQVEMDGIVKKIYSAMLNEDHLKSTLLVLCGDHGMNEAGNHGGSAPGETSPALVFMSPLLQQAFPGLDCPAQDVADDFQYYTVIEQSDIAPTLAGLLGFPVPLNNLGVFIPDMLKLWSNGASEVQFAGRFAHIEAGRDKLRLLQYNSQQVMRIVQAAFPNQQFSSAASSQDCINPDGDALSLHCQWTKAQNSVQQADENGERQRSAIIEVWRACWGTFIQADSCLQFLRSAQQTMSGVASDYDTTSLYLGIILAAMASIVAIIVLGMCSQSSLSFTAWILASSLTYGATMFASSYVEEEQQFWYWVCSGWLLWLHFSR